jgi:hypothetical protein
MIVYYEDGQWVFASHSIPTEQEAINRFNQAVEEYKAEGIDLSVSDQS